jgi:hypothetical protein
MNPTFDDPELFFLEIKTGIVRANIGDIGNFLNAGSVADSPLRNIKLLANYEFPRCRPTDGSAGNGTSSCVLVHLHTSDRLRFCAQQTLTETITYTTCGKKH